MPTDLYRQVTKRRLWQFCYWSGVVVLFGLAAWRRFTLPLDPIADPDTWGYLSPSAKKADGRSVWSYLWPELYLSRLRLSAVALIPRLPCDHCCSACSWTGGWRDTFAYVASRSHFFRASAAFPRVLLRDRVGRGGDVPRGE